MLGRQRDIHAGLTDRELLDRADRNREAIAALFDRYLPLIYGVCMKYLKDPVNSEDATMEIFHVLLEKVPGQGVRDFKPWVYVITKNHCLQILRRRQRTLKNEEEYLMQSDEVEHPVIEKDTDGNPENGLKECLGELNGMQRKTIEMFYFQSMSYDEIADEMDTEKGFVRSYIQNGRRNLKICLNKKNEKRERE